MPIKSYFATPIYTEKLNARDLGGTGPSAFNRELNEQCYLVRETDPEGRKWSKKNYRNGYTSYGSITDLHWRYPHFEQLKGATDRHVTRFAKFLDMDLMGGHLSMTSCWVNIMPANTVHSLHLHPLSVISGTYYVQVPQGASQIKFEDPRLSRFMAAPPKRDGARSRNQPFISMAPLAGQVALWESWLRHEVPANASRADRISISFNYEWVDSDH